MMGLVAAVALTVSSQVTDVTVYNDRAQVVRTADAELASGMNTLRFEGLPEQLDYRSIQVDGAGAAIVLDVRYKVEKLDEIPKDLWRELYAQRDELQLEEKTVLRRLDVLGKSKQLLDQIGSKVTHPAEKEGVTELDPDRWEQMLVLYAEKNMAYDADILAAESELKEIREALARVQEQIASKGADSRKQNRIVEVDLESDTAGLANIRLSYIVRGPKWVPTYDIRVDTDSRRLEVKYFALVRQNTGEDWSDVALKLSTANPGLGGRHPEIEPWRIQMVNPQQVSSLSKSDSLSVDKGSLYAYNSFAPATAGVNLYGVDADNDFSVAETAGDVQMRRRETLTVRQGASVVFEVPGDSSVESDNIEHRVAVSSVELPSSFRYSASPKLDTHAYLKAKAVNSGAHPFLSGKANIYLDGSFVTTSTLEMVSPDEEFWVFLGADESLKVEYKLLKQYESKEGLLGKSIRHTYEYLMTVKNTHAVVEEMIVWDQLPISGSEGLEVKLLEPKYSADSDSLKMDDEKRLSWFRKMAPGEEWEIPFSFYVEAPKDMRILGL